METGGAFSVLQPGSSVATALSEGEAKRKHVVVLEIMGHHVRRRGMGQAFEYKVLGDDCGARGLEALEAG